MIILALDLGTKTGFALLDSDADKVNSGTWTLATPKEIKVQKEQNLHRCCDMRPAALKRYLDVLTPDVIYFEDVQFLSTQYQAQLWASLRCIVTLRYQPCKIVAIPVGTLKKFATGRGNATKEEMALALPGYLVGMDDNEVDALWLLNMARLDLQV